MYLWADKIVSGNNRLHISHGVNDAPLFKLKNKTTNNKQGHITTPKEQLNPKATSIRTPKPSDRGKLATQNKLQALKAFLLKALMPKAFRTPFSVDTNTGETKINGVRIYIWVRRLHIMNVCKLFDINYSKKSRGTPALSSRRSFCCPTIVMFCPCAPKPWFLLSYQCTSSCGKNADAAENGHIFFMSWVFCNALSPAREVQVQHTKL
jgi:hypothetical protein